MSNMIDPVASVITSMLSITPSTGSSSLAATTTLASRTLRTASMSSDIVLASTIESAQSGVSPHSSSEAVSISTKPTPITTSDDSMSEPTSVNYLPTFSTSPDAISTSSQTSKTIDAEIDPSSASATYSSTMHSTKPSLVPSSTLSTITSATPSSSTKPSATTSAQTTSHTSNGAQSHTAAVIVGSVLGAAILITIAYLIFRYCSPIRKRWEARKEEKRKARTYRDAVDGLEFSPGDKDGRNRRSFLARNWYWNGTQQDTSKDQAGLGLGNVSMLRERALAEIIDNPPPRVSRIGAAV